MRQAAPEQVGMSLARLGLARDLMRAWTEDRTLPASAICVARRGAVVLHEGWGRLDPADPNLPGTDKDTIFLTASLTKPVVCAAFMLLVERGKVTLDDAVVQYVPEFAANGKAAVRIRHLLTHTSGLPDMVPNNEELRAAHAPMSKFVNAACKAELLFAPGAGLSYQSAGILMLAEIVQRLAGVTIREFLHREIFQPLGMWDTCLGRGHLPRERTALVRLTDEQAKSGGNWNTDYWRDFGAPWGGMHSTVSDYVRFLLTMLSRGKFNENQVWGRSTVRAMTMDQTSAMTSVPAEQRATLRWGLGFRIHSLVESAHHFGDLISEQTFGHGGATGTVAWADPVRDLVCVIFTTQPGNTCLQRVANAVAAAVIE